MSMMEDNITFTLVSCAGADKQNQMDSSALNVFELGKLQTQNEMGISIYYPQ